MAALGGCTPAVIDGLLAVGIVCAALLVVGLASPLAALGGQQVFLALSGINGHTVGSDDTLMTNILLLLVLSGSGATLSLSSRLRTGQWRSSARIPSWPRYLLIGQLVVLYTATGMQKVSAHWLPGGDLGALYYILQQPSWARYEMTWLAWIFPLTQLATLGTWLFEVGAPVLLLAMWARSTRTRPGRLRALLNRLDYRRLFFLCGMMMHLGIELMMQIGPFGFITLSIYPALWHPEEICGTLRRSVAP